MNDATLDHARRARTGLPEVVYAEFKTFEQTVAIVDEFFARGEIALATRLPDGFGPRLIERYPAGHFDPSARAFRLGESEKTNERIAVVSAGTSDLPVANEAAFTVEALGHEVERHNDVGVAGLHRILSRVDALERCCAVIVVAGMEGALPGVVAGLIHRPVIAVPTSVGYGVSFGGITAMLSMLATCAPGVAVVNIDNGFGAAAVAHKIALAALTSSEERAREAQRGRAP